MKALPGNAWKPRRQYSLLASFALGIADRLRGPLGALGVDHARFRAILELKLALDRRATPFAATDAGLVSGAFALALTGAWLVGFLPGVLAFFGVAPFTWMTLVQAAVLGVVVFFLLAQYGPMLVDGTDIAIVAPLPVPDRTLFAARLAHAMVYVSLLAACTCFWAAFLGPWGLRSWIVAPVVVVCSVGTTTFGVAAVGVVYGAVLALFGPRSFQRFTFWVQILMLSGLIGGMQALQMLVPWERLIAWWEAHPWIAFWLPPAHAGGVLRVCMGQAEARDVGLTALAVLVPVVCLATALKLASRHFVAGLAGDVAAPAPRARGWPRGPGQRFARAAPPGPERASRGLALALCLRDRTFLRAALPGMIPVTVVCLTGGLLVRTPALDALREVGPLVLWCQGLVGAVLAELVRLTEHPRARWLVRASPSATPGPLLVGAVRGALVALFFPALLGVALAIWLVNPTLAAGLDVLVASGGALAIGLWAARRMHLRAPFCYEPKPNDVDLRNLPPVMSVVLVSLGGCVAHALLRLVPGGPLALAVALAVALAIEVPLIVSGWRALARLEPFEPVPE